MRARLTYLPIDIADHFEDFIITRDEQILDAVKARARDFSMLSLLKLLYQVKYKPLTFSELYASSKIRMKRSFLNYLNLCVDYRFITKHTVGSNVFYAITERGMIILDLFMQKSEDRQAKDSVS